VPRRRPNRGSCPSKADYVLKYADGRGRSTTGGHTAPKKSFADKYAKQGFLLTPHQAALAERRRAWLLGRPQKLAWRSKTVSHLQPGMFVSPHPSRLPILKALACSPKRLTDPKLGPYVKSVRDEVRNGSLLRRTRPNQAGASSPTNVRHIRPLRPARGGK